MDAVAPHPLLDLESLPGGDLVAEGLDDLDRGQVTAAALLVSMAASRLRATGMAVPRAEISPELRLYRLLSEQDAATAHRRYNALIGQVVSFARAVEHARPG